MAKKTEASLLLKIKTEGKEKLSALRDGLLSVDAAVNLLGKAKDVIMEFGKAVLDLALAADKANIVKDAFKSLAESQGQDSEAMLKNMRALSKGTISDLELMQQANQALLLGLPVERFDDMLNIARSSAKATGQSMDFMLTSIVTGLGRGSKLMLDNLGIVIDTEKSYVKYAKTLGKTSRELTDLEKKQAFVNEALAIGLKNTEKLGDQTVTLTDKWDKLKATLENNAVTLGNRLAPAIEAVIDAANLTFDAAKQKEFKDKTINSFEELQESLSKQRHEADQERFKRGLAAQKAALAEKAKTEKDAEENIKEEAKKIETEKQKVLDGIIRDVRKQRQEDLLISDMEFLNKQLDQETLSATERASVVLAIQNQATDDFNSRRKEIMNETEGAIRTAQLETLTQDVNNSILTANQKFDIFKGMHDALTAEEAKAVRERDADEKSILNSFIEKKKEILATTDLEIRAAKLESLGKEVQDAKISETAKQGLITDIANEEQVAREKFSNESIVRVQEIFGVVLNEGVAGIAKAGLSALAEIYVKGSGKIVGQVFDILAAESEVFQQKIATFFSPEFVGNIIRNLFTILDKAPELTEALISGLIAQMPQFVSALAKTFLNPDFHVSLAKATAKGVAQGFVEAGPEISKTLKKAVKDIGGSLTDFATGGISKHTGGDGGGNILSGIAKTFGFADGGKVPSLRYLADGGRGSDTVPAMLTPDEFVVNRNAAQRNLSLLEDMNAGKSVGGGSTININVNGGLLGNDADARVFAKAIDEQLMNLRQNNESLAFDSDII